MVAQISFAKANRTAIFIFKEEESAVSVCLGELEKIWWPALMTTTIDDRCNKKRELTCYIPTMN